jgi:hypothetical protein
MSTATTPEPALAAAAPDRPAVVPIAAAGPDPVPPLTMSRLSRLIAAGTPVPEPAHRCVQGALRFRGMRG